MSIVRRHFTRKLGWRLDADFAKSDEFRVIQFTPHNSQVLSIGGEKSLGNELGSVVRTAIVGDIAQLYTDFEGTPTPAQRIRE